MRGLVIVPRKVTINMVAERAGVSRGTVDRVLNQRPHVKPELYERIVRAMKELGYVPPKEEQAIALGLPSAQIRPCKIGVLLSNENGYIKSEFLRGIADASHLLQDYMVDVLVEECETAMQDECVERIEDLVSARRAGNLPVYDEQRPHCRKNQRAARTGNSGCDVQFGYPRQRASVLCGTARRAKRPDCG